MPFYRIRELWEFPVKEVHEVRLEVDEGFFNDTMRVYVDSYLVATARAGLAGFKGSQAFEIDGRIFHLRYLWSIWTGNPISIVIEYNGRIFAKYGNDRALPRNR